VHPIAVPSVLARCRSVREYQVRTSVVPTDRLLRDPRTAKLARFVVEN
jgi:hypothetical protein